MTRPPIVPLSERQLKIRRETVPPKSWNRPGRAGISSENGTITDVCLVFGTGSRDPGRASELDTSSITGMSHGRWQDRFLDLLCDLAAWRETVLSLTRSPEPWPRGVQAGGMRKRLKEKPSAGDSPHCPPWPVSGHAGARREF